MLESLAACCKKLGLTISCKKTKFLAVLPPDLTSTPIHLIPGEEPIGVVSSFQYLGSTIQQDCSLDSEVNSILVSVQSLVATKEDQGLNKAQVVILPTLLYGLETAVLIQPHHTGGVCLEQ